MTAAYCIRWAIGLKSTTEKSRQLQKNAKRKRLKSRCRVKHQSQLIVSRFTMNRQERVKL